MIRARNMMAPLLAAGLVAASSAPASAEVKAIGRYKDWRVYTEGSGSSLVCFAATPAADLAPKDLSHGYVAAWKGKSANQSSLRVGYPLRADIAPTAVIGRDRFEMFASGSEAFVPDNREAPLAAAIKKGTELRVEAASVKEGRAAYHFSLKGSTEAIDKARSLCR
jgi:invasion protein IalB